MIMTKSAKKLNQFLKKLLRMSRNDVQCSFRSSGMGLSFTSSSNSEFSSRSLGSSNGSAGYESVSAANSGWEEEAEWWSSHDPVQEDVPVGSLPVYVGEARRRFVIPTSYLSNNVFRALLEKSAEEYGLRCQGGLRIACSPQVFEHLLWWLEAGETTHEY